MCRISHMKKCVLFHLCDVLNLVYMPYNIVVTVLVLYKIDKIFSA